MDSKSSPTQRALDARDSAQFTSIFQGEFIFLKSKGKKASHGFHRNPWLALIGDNYVFCNGEKSIVKF